MAVALTGNSAAVLEWSTAGPGVRLTLLESGERWENEALEMGVSQEWGIPSDLDLYDTVLRLLHPSLVSTQAADQLWTSARFGLLRWFPAASLSGSVRQIIERAMEATVWV
ncbi:hypothetical protein GTY75_05225 [Streptomyces sp. SID8381]|uniref:hypothetical protein n=1 Tax=unclassified Streptomyces TaxID=2593676 RepID=UPI00131A4581|nr:MULTISPECIES: hypothetical protein [unclassified Streptomyces]MYX26075.1 hypothetical protein [Streptomyces sp. SID8381]